jgi:hypothetical protein
MGNAAADENQSAGYDVTPYYSASDAGKETANEGVLKKGVMQNIHAAFCLVID